VFKNLGAVGDDLFGQQMIEKMKAPNETEFETIAGISLYEDEAALEGIMREWQAKHKPLLIITRGSKGASYLEQGVQQTLSAPKVEVIDTTGVASYAVTKFCAQAGMPTFQEIIRNAIRKCHFPIAFLLFHLFED
jgi:ribokinase